MDSLNRSIRFVDLVLRFGRGECDIKSVDAELRRHEQSFNIAPRIGDTSLAVPGYKEIPDGDEVVWNRYVTGDFYHFLDHTHAVMHGMFVSDHCHVLFEGKYSLTATARAWGQIYSDWANRSSWLGKTDWTYVQFQTGSISDEFSEWMDAFYDFLGKRNRV